MSIDRTLDKKMWLIYTEDSFSVIKKNEVICKKMSANGDINIGQLKEVSENNNCTCGPYIHIYA